MSKTFILSSSGETPHIDFSGDLNAEQLAAVKNADGPSLVLAGAGSGKTRTIIYRVAHLLKQGTSPEHILLLTFTNKAAREMLSRVEYLLGAMPSRLLGGTFHHVANLFLRRHAAAAGFGANFSILDQEDSRDLLNVCIKDAGIDTKQKRFPSASVLQSFWSYSRNARLPFAETVELKQPRLLGALDQMEAVVAAYEKRKKDANAMDFDDLLVHVTDLLRQNPPIRERLASQYRYVLVDEYQDTNRVQAEFLDLISSVHKNLLVVGDDAQSIYSFRAADVKNILSFPERYPDSKIFKLETNYRSVPPILELANESIRWNIDQFPKELRPASRHPELVEGRQEAVRKPDKPNLVAAANAEEESQFIAEMILKLRDEGVPMSEIAVLFRATFHSQALEFELTKRDIPYDYRGGIRFFERSHIKDALSFLRIAANPADEVSWLRVLRLQTGIGTETAGKIFAICRGVTSLKEALSRTKDALSSRAQGGWNDFAKTVEAMLAAGESPAEAIRSVVKSSYGDYLDNEFPNAEERREDLEQLAVFAEKYESLGGFLAESALHEGYAAERTESGGADEERIVLSTIHQAKGLEWDAVFVMHLFDGAFPNARAMEEDGGMEEERRLFYVACTRARKSLFLSYPMVGGGDRDYLHQPSQFVHELPESCFERVELRRASNIDAGTGKTYFHNDSDDDAIELDELGDPLPPRPSRGEGRVRGESDWRKKSFLGDY
jgi:DNA helicase II / ATP-dependent DNA helicase PcrA